MREGVDLFGELRDLFKTSARLRTYPQELALIRGARIPTVRACSVAVVSAAFNLSFPTPATLEDIGQQ